MPLTLLPLLLAVVVSVVVPMLVLRLRFVLNLLLSAEFCGVAATTGNTLHYCSLYRRCTRGEAGLGNQCFVSLLQKR